MATTLQKVIFYHILIVYLHSNYNFNNKMASDYSNSSYQSKQMASRKKLYKYIDEEL
jgi:hypothetical protein